MIEGQLALAFASAFFGAALYINIVEQPARLSLDEDAMLKEWRPSDRRGAAMLALFALLSGALGVAAFAATSDLRWLVGAVIILASWPYAFFVLVPLNNSLLSSSTDNPASSVRWRLRQWGLLEWGQTLVGLVAASTFTWAMT